MIYPENLLYTKEHEWVRVEGEFGVIGITDHAQHELGDIVFADVNSGHVDKGSILGSVESVKAVSDVYAPVSGEIVERNAAIAANPEFINEDPYGRGWLVKVKFSSPDELKSLLPASDYQSYVGA